MKRDKAFGVWTRCTVCGTIFPDRTELREHAAAKHASVPAEQEPIDYSVLEDEPQIIPVVNRPPQRFPFARR
jgi:hypothetical protein